MKLRASMPIVAAELLAVAQPLSADEPVVWAVLVVNGEIRCRDCSGYSV